MAEENQQDPNQQKKDIQSPSFPITNDKKSKDTDGKGSGEEKKIGLQVPQPFIVRVEKEKKKWLNFQSIISILAVFISITAVILNKCSLDNTSKSLAITDSTFRTNRIKDSIAFTQFEIQNQSYLQIQSAEIKINDTTKKGYIEYKIMNIGNQPAKILDEDINERDQIIPEYKVTTIKDTENISPRQTIFKRYVSKESPYSEEIDLGKIDPIEIDWIKTGKERIFLTGHIRYQNLVTNKIRWYTFKLLMEDFPVTGFTMIDNENDSISHKFTPYNAFPVKQVIYKSKKSN